jgi:hypothetical protein
VRLRVVQECDVALLAESPDDAKARAEADLGRGDRFEDVQDGWPVEMVSVEAVAVDQYPELEDLDRSVNVLGWQAKLVELRLVPAVEQTDRLVGRALERRLDLGTALANRNHPVFLALA